jgi:hypothetical protein
MHQENAIASNERHMVHQYSEWMTGIQFLKRYVRMALQPTWSLIQEIQMALSAGGKSAERHRQPHNSTQFTDHECTELNHYVPPRPYS